MASYGYTRSLNEEDVAPREVHVYTKKELRENWWDYNLKWVIIGIGSVLTAAYFLLEAFVFTPKTDYQIVVVTPETVSEFVLSEINDIITPVLPDATGDGEVVVNVLSYTIDLSTFGVDEYSKDVFYENTYDYYDAMAGQVLMSADITSGETNIFILYDPESFQRATSALCYLDGTMPQDPQDVRWTDLVYSIDDTLLSDTRLAASGDYYIARRNSTTDQDIIEKFAYYQGAWDALTQGATPLESES